MATMQGPIQSTLIMKLTLKLPLAFFVFLLLMFASALYGLSSLNRSVAEYQSVIQGEVANERAISSALFHFKMQVQEWKDLLLRGKDPDKLAHGWQAFEQQERTVDDDCKVLLTKLPDGEARRLVQNFLTAHETMGQGYRKGLDAFKAAEFDSAAGDHVVAGVDREPSTLLSQAAHEIASLSASASAQAAVDAHRASMISISLMLVALAAGLGGAIAFSRTITQPLVRAVDVARTVATGDLSTDIRAEGSDEIGELLAALREMQTNLADVVSSVRRNAEGVASASAQIAAGNLNLSQRTEEQAASLQQTAASMEELTGAVRRTTTNANDASSLAQQASSIADAGGEAMGRVVDTMSNISESSSKVGEIISVIEGIAFQTNILALNAAVEAARAGEQGRGFAVVAGEVRSLAQRSANAAREIKTLIETSSDSVESGAEIVRGAGKIIGDIVVSVGQVTRIVSDISSACTEQTGGIEQINLAVGQMDEVTQQNAALVEQATAAAQAMAEQAEALRTTVEVFKLKAAA
jgi:methyl-accepting chemotaxis protein-1 (serine sensor receptor)